LGSVELGLSEEKLVDLDGDDRGDLRVILSDYSRDDASRGAVVRFELLNAEIAAGGIQEGAAGAAGSPGAAAEPGVPPVEAAAVSAPVFSSPSAYPFTLQAAFTGYCMFRWESDQRTREEMYFHRADVQNIQAQNGIRLWLSNAGAVRLQVIGGGRTVPLEVGGAGEVAVADLRWVRDEDGRFALVLIKLD
jgi:hypothetical protein